MDAERLICPLLSEEYICTGSLENYSDSDTSIGSSTRFKTLINKTRNDEELAKVYHNLGNSLIFDKTLSTFPFFAIILISKLTYLNT